MSKHNETYENRRMRAAINVQRCISYMQYGHPKEQMAALEFLTEGALQIQDNDSEAALTTFGLSITRSPVHEGQRVADDSTPILLLPYYPKEGWVSAGA